MEKDTPTLSATELVRTPLTEDTPSPFATLKQIPSVRGKVVYLVTNVDTFFGIEMTGSDRVAPEAREQNVVRQMLSVTGVWFAACGGLTSMESFLLGSLMFNLGLKQALVTGIITQAVGCIAAAYASTMGPKSGLRQIVSSRFVLGWWLVRFGAVVNVVGLVGWSIVNAVVGGQILQALSDNRIGLVLGIVLLVVFAFLVAVFGIRYLLRVETCLAIPVVVSVLLMYIVCSDKYQYASNANLTASPRELLGNSLSYAAVGYTVTASWTGIASDYYVLFPESTSSLRVFGITFFGLFVPTTFVAVIGTLIGNIALNYPPWLEAYTSNGIGGVVSVVFGRWNGFGKFVVVILFLSLICNSVLNLYSVAFSLQLISSYLGRVPRWLWTFVMSVITLACALAGRNKASTILSNLLPMLGYWISMYLCLLVEENLVFRTIRFHPLYTKEKAPQTALEATYGSAGPQKLYSWEAWNDRAVVTHGIAATISVACGVVGAVLGMDQAYFTGPLASKAGGDIGIWLAVAMVSVTYPGARYLELRIYGR